MCLFLTYVSTPFVSAKSDKSVQNLLEVSSRLLISPFYKLEYRILSFIVIIHHDILSNIPRLTQVPAARYYLQLIHPAGDYELWLILSCNWLEFQWLDSNAADLYFNISSKFKVFFCKMHHFYGLFFTTWFQVPLMQAMTVASRTLKKLEEAWGSLKNLLEAWRL